MGCKVGNLSEPLLYYRKADALNCSKVYFQILASNEIARRFSRHLKSREKYSLNLKNVNKKMTIPTIFLLRLRHKALNLRSPSQKYILFLLYFLLSPLNINILSFNIRSICSKIFRI